MGLVSSGATAAEVIIVQGRKVIMNQTKAVDHFQGDGCRNGVGTASTYCLARAKCKYRAHALTASQHRVLHRFAQFGRQEMIG